MKNKFILIIILVIVVGLGALLLYIRTWVEEVVVIVQEIDVTATEARDFRRIADARQLVLVLERETAIWGGLPLEGRTVADAKTITCTGPGAVREFFLDIKDPKAGDGADICGTFGL